MVASHTPVEPYFFHRLLKEKVWGGSVLSAALGIELPFSGPLGETWELSDYPGEETTVRGGAEDGVSLRSLMEKEAATILGHSRPSAEGRFPLLVKFLDAGHDLSVQIHPPDGPRSPTGVGKTEAWYILNRTLGAGVVCGLKQGTTAEVFEAEAGDSRVRAHLEEIAVEPGDCILIPAGQTHAVRSGVVLCEVQQTSNVTYRMYDWDRLGLDGQPRQTHVKEALSVVDYSLPASTPTRASCVDIEGLQLEELTSCAYFRLLELQADVEGGEFFTQGFAHTLSVIGGSGTLSALDGSFRERPLVYGDTLLLPGSLAAVHFSGSATAPLKILVGVAL